MEKEDHLKMYVLILDWVDVGHAVNTACHAGAMISSNWDPQCPIMKEWYDTSFRKVTCKVNEQEFENAKNHGEWFAVTEMAFDGKEVALVFKPRREWPKFFKFLRLYK